MHVADSLLTVVRVRERVHVTRSDLTPSGIYAAVPDGKTEHINVVGHFVYLLQQAGHKARAVREQR